MKKTVIALALTMVLLVLPASGTFASEQDGWVYPDNILAFMFRLGIASEAAGIETSTDPYVLMEEGQGYVFMSVGELVLMGMFDPGTQQLMALMFPMDDAYYDEQLIILAALCEEVAVTTGSLMTKERFLQLGEIVYSQAIAGIMEAEADFSIGEYSFGVMLQENNSGQLNMIIRAN